MTNSLAPLGTVTKLATVAERYIRDMPAPDPFSVTLYPGTGMIQIQPGGCSSATPVATLGALLVWTYPLTGVTGDWWRTAEGQLHITLRGRGPCGVRFKVYSSIPYRTARHVVVLHKGDQESVTPDELYRLALEIRKGQTT